ncbi:MULTISPECIES: metal ABC transporter ATP-binding protein [Planococcus]|uniref:Manganese transporter n=1 Tax=Planococcus faecalis TaxID=1598147 RepID=A0ABM6ISB8_9BACL|nr:MULTISPECIES: metal ABC transporter ATP-binding protein [Planococcus]AQU79482.1 manganese transporter [Planococcus faecalis]MDJ0332562.1 metal ABC transporter ATP-binding protein [Planococcus sp. S3-L1]OHX51447.1 manganese transporter [Planococcus faecalis]
MVPAVKVENIQVSYFGRPAIEAIDLTLEQGKVLGIIGPNGAGKSTLLKALLNLVSIDQGSIEIFGETLKENRKRIAYVPQRNQYDWDFPIHVLDTVLIGTYPNLGIFKRPKKKDKEWAYECLKKVGMEEFSNRQIGELSGGQQQRVFLARALAQKADIFFLDEPFVGIDVSSEEMIVKLLKDLRDQGKTVVVVHHDLSKANEYFDELLLLNKQVIQFGNPQQVLRPEVMRKAYESELSFLFEVGVN